MRLSPRVLTGERRQALESMVMTFLSHAREPKASHLADAELARDARVLCARILDRAFWDQRKR